MIHRAAVVLACVLVCVLACAAALAACTSKTGGESTPNATITLEFRKVVQTEPANGKAHSLPAAAPPADQAAIDKAKEARQRLAVTDRAAVRAAVEGLDCAAPDPLRGKDDPTLPLVTCDPVLPAKYVLEPAFLTGADVESARAEQAPQSTEWVVALTFRADGARGWADFTTNNVGKQVAVVLDALVLSAPEIREPILAGATVINGGSGGFTKNEAEDLARKLGAR